MSLYWYNYTLQSDRSRAKQRHSDCGTRFSTRGVVQLYLQCRSGTSVVRVVHLPVQTSPDPCDAPRPRPRPAASAPPAAFRSPPKGRLWGFGCCERMRSQTRNHVAVQAGTRHTVKRQGPMENII